MSLGSEMFIIFHCNLKAPPPDVCSLRQQTFYFPDLWFCCSTLRLAGPVWAAPTATPAPPHCGDATGTESPCVTPVASTWSCMGSVPSTAFNTVYICEMCEICAAGPPPHNHTCVQVPRPLAMKKESIQTRKRKPKMPKTKTSAGGTEQDEQETMPLERKRRVVLRLSSIL